jgi:Phage tail tube protein
MAVNTNRIGGTLSFLVDGNQYEARGNFQVLGMVVERTGVAGQDGVHGYIEVPIVPHITGEISIGNFLSIGVLEQFTQSTIQINLANGHTYVLTQAWYKGGSVIDAHDGKVPVTFQGMTIQEI